MSKDNMEELQRWENDLRYGNPLSRAEDGAWVRFSDVEEREARFQARIKELAQDRDDMTDTILGLRERIEELEVIVSGKTMYDGAEASEARWRERIQELIDDWPENATWNESEEAADAWTAATGQLRSLLDSGEESNEDVPVAVPEKVEVNRADLELILTDTDIYYPGYAEGSDEPSGLPERGAAAEDRLRAALAAFRATDTGGTD